MRSAVRLFAGLSIIGLVSIPSGDLRAQASASSLEITVRTAEGNQPLRGAQVILEGVGVRGITDRSGFLRIPNLPSGPGRISVRYLGYAPMDEVVSFVPGRPTRLLVNMGIQPIELAPVRVRGRALLASRGFYDRQRMGQGTFITRSDILDANPRYMSDILRRTSGVTVGAPRLGGMPTAAMRGGSSARCPIQFFVDGALAANFNIDEVMPWDIEGVEIYRGAATIPPAYNKGTAMCGVILIWTRVE